MARVKQLEDIAFDHEFIDDLARKYANVCQFKSDFPHDFDSVKAGYIEGFLGANDPNKVM